jgi:hypothetical protein
MPRLDWQTLDEMMAEVVPQLPEFTVITTPMGGNLSLHVAPPFENQILNDAYDIVSIAQQMPPAGRDFDSQLLARERSPRFNAIASAIPKGIEAARFRGTRLRQTTRITPIEENNT